LLENVLKPIAFLDASKIWWRILPHVTLLAALRFL
jgi:hypothetical protein